MAAADEPKTDAKTIEIKIGEKSLNPKNDPAAAHAALVLASATSDPHIRAQIVTLMSKYLTAQEFDYAKLAPSFPRLPSVIGGSIVYIAQPAMEMPSPLSAWVHILTKKMIESGNACYNPEVPFTEIFSRDRDLGRVFARGLDVSIKVSPAIGLPPWVEQPGFKVADDIQLALARLDAGDTTIVRALSSFILLRSRVVVADLNTPSYGGTLQALELANLAGIPILGVSNRVTISPWVLDIVTAVVPADVTKIISILRTWLFT